MTFADEPPGTVLLIHGFFSKRLLMVPLAWRVRRKGYPVINWGYFSLYGSVSDHARRLRIELERICQTVRPLHVVAHSMGAAVLRLALSFGPLENLGRIVLIAPPNGGSPVARWIGPWFKSFCPGLLEISDNEGSLVQRISSCQQLDIGIIAGRFDWVVPPSKTTLAEQSDYVCLPATHNSLLIQRSVARHVTAFLSNGRFRR